MLLMQARYGRLKDGYGRQDFYALVEEVYEEPLTDFWSKWVESSEPLEGEIKELLHFVGLSFSEGGALEIVDESALSHFKCATKG